MANGPYSDWQSLDSWDTTVPDEYSGDGSIDIGWDLNKDGVVNVSDITHGMQYQG